ncbi:cytochrome c oxidase assembly protein COX19-like [Mya arenaria]|uniref:cytochrome c oxidase assembly protein COX19-like n=1 Tax=Mya arenaria TaxID=6604 RepID=UPI0022DFA5AC|nr:cytochrome c oxidase assembly protein COX19-like [Mya arenaria]XP_052789342.1 cytochrome c oxidase assembly protein COX19-like [Mya arenaria]
MATPAVRFKPRPPDRGSFPIDHNGVCKNFMNEYMECLSNNNYDNSKCREQSKVYLQCRMENQLMEKENWKRLGYADLVNTESGDT